MTPTERWCRNLSDGLWPPMGALQKQGVCHPLILAAYVVSGAEDTAMSSLNEFAAPLPPLLHMQLRVQRAPRFQDVRQRTRKSRSHVAHRCSGSPTNVPYLEPQVLIRLRNGSHQQAASADPRPRMRVHSPSFTRSNAKL